MKTITNFFRRIFHSEEMTVEEWNKSKGILSREANGRAKRFPLVEADKEKLKRTISLKDLDSPFVGGKGTIIRK